MLGPALPIVMVKLVVVPAAMLALATLLAMLAPTWVVITPVAVPVTGSHLRWGQRGGVGVGARGRAVTSMTTLTVAPAGW